MHWSVCSWILLRLAGPFLHMHWSVCSWILLEPGHHLVLDLGFCIGHGGLVDLSRGVCPRMMGRALYHHDRLSRIGRCKNAQAVPRVDVPVGEEDAAPGR